jgi:hypothetical protein
MTTAQPDSAASKPAPVVRSTGYCAALRLSADLVAAAR